MRTLIPFKVGENSNKITRQPNLINLGGLKVLVCMASNEKAKVHARKNNRERQGGGNQQKWTWSKTLIEKL